MDKKDSKKVVAESSNSQRGKKRAEVPKAAVARSQKGKEAKVIILSSETSDTSSSDESEDFIEEFLRAHKFPHLYPPCPSLGEGRSRDGVESKIWPSEARAAKNKREASSAATTSSAPQSPTASNMDRSKRIRMEEETSSRQEREVVDLSGQDDPSHSGPHRLSAGVPAEDFVLPPIYAHDELLTGETKVKINPADEAILSDMGPEALRTEIATQSMALLKLVEVATFLNGRECKYLEERDEARRELPLLKRWLAESEASCEVYREEHKTISANLKEAEDRLKTVSEERDSAVQKADEQNVLIGELEGKLERLQVTGVIEDGEKELDPQGEYASSSRAVLIAKIQELESNMVAAATFSFNNAVAQLKILNPSLIEEGLDEEKEVRDGAIVTPSDDEV
ncbi:unnamed protein product [Trifolium pratense]|uniref:Uncharacterized protein n=1 Tax=Trifolium pratense TaxID=57577 RepID=A0ACB0JKJ2_TRIPR|nr:unnamed protein product [Trifolium pratense]